MSWALIALAAASFSAVTWFAWAGKLGFAAIGALLVAAVAFFAGRRKLPKGAKRSVDLVAKISFTVVGIMALLRHPIKVEIEGVATELPIYEAMAQYITTVDQTTFITYALIAMGVKFVGVISSAFAWHLLLKGQGIRFPFWSKIMTAFLIGRFIGTFLPSTIGLDGYTAYEAGRYSNEWPRVLTAKFLEKIIGVTGLFLGMVVTLPFGYQVIVDVTGELGRPEAAPVLAGVIAAVAGGLSLGVVGMVVFPVLIDVVMGLVMKVAGKQVGILQKFKEAMTAYKGQLGLLLLALSNKFVTHFTTATVYYFTALAIGVSTAAFWPIVFGSNIQILATLFSPTIAGEGAREAFQALLLSNQLGGVAQAVLSGALGFIAAEAATMWGGAFLLVRKAGWRPAFALVDGKQVDYSWINDAEDDGSFDAEKIAALRAEHAQAKND